MTEKQKLEVTKEFDKDLWLRRLESKVLGELIFFDEYTFICPVRDMVEVSMFWRTILN